MYTYLNTRVLHLSYRLNINQCSTSPIHSALEIQLSFIKQTLKCVFLNHQGEKQLDTFKDFAANNSLFTQSKGTN